MRNDLALSLTGFSLIAVTYGLARFSWGLMLPDIAQDVPFSPRIAGVIAACSFVAYCLASLSASRVTARFGPRLTGITATLFAAAGLMLLASAASPGMLAAGLCHTGSMPDPATLTSAASPGMLAAGLFIAGLSSGLASPSLAAAVSRCISADRQPQVNTVINAGTGGGIILSVPVLMLLPGGWRSACMVFAVIALLCLIPLLRWLTGRSDTPAAPDAGIISRLRQPVLRRLAAIALVSGIASAAWWSFGPDVLRQHVQVDDYAASLLWLVSGGAGVLGVFTGPAAARFGLAGIYRVAQLAMALPLLVLSFTQGFNSWLIPAVALCGAGYITLSGVLLVHGANAAPDAPASGVGLAFFMLAVGQVIGSMLFGLLYNDAGAPAALIAFCVLGLGLAGITPERSAARLFGKLPEKKI